MYVTQSIYIDFRSSTASHKEKTQYIVFYSLRVVYIYYKLNGISRQLLCCYISTFNPKIFLMLDDNVF